MPYAHPPLPIAAPSAMTTPLPAWVASFGFRGPRAHGASPAPHTKRLRRGPLAAPTTTCHSHLLIIPRSHARATHQGFRWLPHALSERYQSVFIFLCHSWLQGCDRRKITGVRAPLRTATHPAHLQAYACMPREYCRIIVASVVSLVTWCCLSWHVPSSKV